MKSESEKYQQRFFSPKHAVILAFSKETAGGVCLPSQCVQSEAEMCFLCLYKADESRFVAHEPSCGDDAGRVRHMWIKSRAEVKVRDLG